MNFSEKVFNGESIDWQYWSQLDNITPHQAAKLVNRIDPIIWPHEKFAGREKNGTEIPKAVQTDIARLEQRLDFKNWSLIDLIAFLGADNVPLGMTQISHWESNITNTNPLSPLNNPPHRGDVWFDVISAAIQDFIAEHAETPNKNQIWSRLRTKSPIGFAVKPAEDRGEEAIETEKNRKLGKSAFMKRWKRYCHKETINTISGQ